MTRLQESIVPGQSGNCRHMTFTFPWSLVNAP